MCIPLGKSGSMDHLLLSEDEIKNENIEFFKINRGGDITYHGPGQITGYLIMDLEEFTTDVHLFVRNIEEAIIRYIWQHGALKASEYQIHRSMVTAG
jgi:lipoyl(octanoyl) transferase